MRTRALWIGFLVVLLGLAACAPFMSSILVPRPEPTPARPTASAPEAQLGVIEVPIVAAKVMGPGRFEYNDQLGDEVRAQIEALHDLATEQRLAQANAALAPFGYRIESRFDPERNRTLFDVYREGESEPRFPGLSSISPVSVNASGSEFVFVAEDAPDASSPYLLVRNGAAQTWDPGANGWQPPSYVGDVPGRIIATGFPTITYRVELGGQVVYTGAAVAIGAYVPFRSFTTWDDHWVLEVDDHLIMDGIDINQAVGYDAAFGFTRIGDQEFYFFERGGQTQISYGDQVLPNTYDVVFHNHCCEASIHNVEAGPNAVWFHALRDGTWCFVEASLDG
jgi:hypothetical protein